MGGVALFCQVLGRIKSLLWILIVGGILAYYDYDENTWGSSLREVGSPFGIKSPYPRCNPYLGEMVIMNDEEFSGDNFDDSDDFNDAGFVLIYYIIFVPEWVDACQESSPARCAHLDINANQNLCLSTFVFYTFVHLLIYV